MTCRRPHQQVRSWAAHRTQMSSSTLSHCSPAHLGVSQKWRVVAEGTELGWAQRMRPGGKGACWWLCVCCRGWGGCIVFCGIVECSEHCSGGWQLGAQPPGYKPRVSEAHTWVDEFRPLLFLLSVRGPRDLQGLLELHFSWALETR